MLDENDHSVFSSLHLMKRSRDESVDEAMEPAYERRRFHPRSDDDNEKAWKAIAAVMPMILDDSRREELEYHTSLYTVVTDTEPVLTARFIELARPLVCWKLEKIEELVCREQGDEKQWTLRARLHHPFWSTGWPVSALDMLDDIFFYAARRAPDFSPSSTICGLYRKLNATLLMPMIEHTWRKRCNGLFARFPESIHRAMTGIDHVYAHILTSYLNDRVQLAAYQALSQSLSPELWLSILQTVQIETWRDAVEEML